MFPASPSQPAPMEPEKEFILCLESLPLLWDKTHRFYVHKYKRNEALEKLSHILRKVKPSSSIEDVKKKINSLRSNYRQELKKIEVSRRSGAGADDIYNPKSWTFEYLHFLNKFEKPQILGSDNEEGEEEAPTQLTVSEGTPSSRPSTSISSIAAVPPPSPRPTKAKKSLLNQQNELLQKAVEYLKESDANANSSNSIALDWAQTLNRLEPTQRLFAKKAINDVLFEAEMGNLDRNSVISPIITYEQCHMPASCYEDEMPPQQE